MVKKEKNKKSKLKTYLQMPHILTVLIIFVLAIITIVVSIIFKDSKQYLSSIFANVFAGLLTGLIICLISAVKSINLYKIACQMIWLEGLRKECCNFFQMYNKMLLQKNDFTNPDEYYDYIYDVICEGNNISVGISQAEFDKSLAFNPDEYCKINFDYDSREIMDRNEKLREYVINTLDVTTVTPSELRQQFDVMYKPLHKLNCKVYNKISDLKAREKVINLSII